MENDLRTELLKKVIELQKKIYDCPHCNALKKGISNLYAIMPPEPVYIQRGNELMKFLTDMQKIKD